MEKIRALLLRGPEILIDFKGSISRPPTVSWKIFPFLDTTSGDAGFSSLIKMVNSTLIAQCTVGFDPATSMLLSSSSCNSLPLSVPLSWHPPPPAVFCLLVQCVYASS